jgi:hypothetical protein
VNVDASLPGGWTKSRFDQSPGTPSHPGGTWSAVTSGSGVKPALCRASEMAGANSLTVTWMSMTSLALKFATDVEPM